MLPISVFLKIYCNLMFEKKNLNFFVQTHKLIVFMYKKIPTLLVWQAWGRFYSPEGNSIGKIGNLQNPTQMLIYNLLKFIPFLSWSSKGAWSWWLVPLAPPLGRKRWGFDYPIGIIFSIVLLIKDWVFHPRFISGWRWRLHPTWSFPNSTWGEGKPKLGQYRSPWISHIIIDGRDLPSARIDWRAFTAPQWHINHGVLIKMTN
jgi:hypothetical protein